MSQKGSTSRFFSVLPFAAITTLVLFFVMFQLISNDTELKEKETYPKPVFSRQIEDSPTPTAPIDPTEPLPDPPPTPKPVSTEVDSDPGMIGPGPQPPKPDDIIEGTTSPTGGSAISKLPPAYPSACHNSNAEGIVIVEFDVNANGIVVNPRIVRSDHNCFKKAALKAVSKWKFTPSQGGSKTIIRSGVRETFRFTLTD